jgi:hypothetical protein
MVRAALIAFGALVFALFLSSRLYAIFMQALKSHRVFFVILFLLCAGALYLFHEHIAKRPEEEPLLLLQGVSVWGSELLRITGLALAVGFLWKAVRDIRYSNESLSADFMPSRAGGPGPAVRVADFLAPWSYDKYKKTDSGQGTILSVEKLWSNYLRLASPMNIALRAMIATVVFILAGLVLATGDLPSRPVRGPASYWVDFFLTVAVVVVYVFLAFFVADAVRMCKSFVRHLSTGKSEWPRETTQRFIVGLDASRGRLPRSLARYNFLRDYIDMRLIAERTETIGSFIYYPFIVLLLIICARSPLLDNWGWNPSLLVMLGFSAALILLSAYALRLAAEGARDAALRRLGMELLRAKARDDKLGAELLTTAVQSVQNVSEGAYRPFLQQPIVRGLLIPFGGYGGLAILEYFLIGRL